IHETYGPLPPGAGGVTEPAPGDPSGGGGTREYASSEQFETAEPRIAERSREHRRAARSITSRLVDRLIAAADNDAEIADFARSVVVTSDEATVAYVSSRMKEVCVALKTAQRADRLDRDLL